MRFYVETYGCWLNKGDSDTVISRLLDLGHVMVERPEDADLIVINTCAVREESEIKVFRRLRELSRLRGKRVVVMGCLVRVAPLRIREIVPDAVLVDANSVEMIDKIVSDVTLGRAGTYFSEIRPMEVLPRYLPEVHGHVYVVPIQVGCLCSCTFCVTRFTRSVIGKVRSYPIDAIVESVKKAVRLGAREIYLTGQDVACYGFDRGYDLADLLERVLNRVEGRYLIRVGMAEPSEYMKIADRVLDVMKDERVYKFFHLPVQSGSDKVLRLMRRRYTVNEYVKLIEKIRRVFPEACIVTDVIVGFPGESEEDFLMSVELVRKLKFDKVHVARYSPRPFTEGAVMDGKVSEPEKKRRSRIMTKVVNEISLERNNIFVGRELKTILSSLGLRGQGVTARALNYKPVIVDVEASLIGSFARVRVDGCTHAYLTGIVIELEDRYVSRSVSRMCLSLEEDSS